MLEQVPVWVKGIPLLGALVGTVASAISEGGLLEGLASQAPALGVLVLLVVLFLRFLSDQETKRQAAAAVRDKLFAQALRDRDSEAGEQAAAVADAIQENSRCLGEVKGVLAVLDLRKQKRPGHDAGTRDRRD